MKKKLNFGILAIMGVVVFSACGSDSDLFDPEKAAAKKEAQYASAFVQKYGEIAVDQDWGFGASVYLFNGSYIALIYPLIRGNIYAPISFYAG